MSTRAIRLKFTETDLLDPQIRRAARKASRAADKVDEAFAKLESKKKLRKEREFAAYTLHQRRHAENDVKDPKLQQRQRNKVQQEARKRRIASEQTAQATTKLRFSESEIKKPSQSLRFVGDAVTGAMSNSIRSNNQDNNAGVQSGRFLADASYQTTRKIDRAAYSRRLKQYAHAERLRAKSDAANIDALYQKAIKKDPAIASNPLSRWRQKQEIKRRYAAVKAKRQAAATGKTAGQTAVDGIAKTTERILEYAKSHSHFLVTIVGFLLLFMMLSGAVTSCSAMFSGVGNMVLVTSYTAETADILGAEEDYCAMEDALRARIRNLQNSGNYDEYRLNVDEIGHNPWELAALLTVLKENYTRAEVQGLLRQIFDAQYSYSTSQSTETVTETKAIRVGESLGVVTTSAYCSCSICCGQWSGGPTASGVYPRANHTLAVDARNPFVPMGTKVVMNGIVYTVEDTGNFARYGVQFDVYYDDHQTALQHGHQNWECYLADSNGSNMVEVTTTETKSICTITLVNHTLRSVINGMGLTADQLERFELLMETHGNRSELFEDDLYANSTGDYLHYDIPGEALTDTKFRNMINEAEKYLGYPYVWGGSSPSTSFDCSGFVSWVINHCGNGWNVGRQTAESLRGYCSIIPASEAKPGDLIFFKGTYNTTGASHVGIYVGNGMMIHCGNPISYASIDTAYWQNHFYCYGRIR